MTKDEKLANLTHENKQLRRRACSAEALLAEEKAVTRQLRKENIAMCNAIEALKRHVKSDAWEKAKILLRAEENGHS